MTTTRDRITTEPQTVTLIGDRTHVELAITLTARCPHGHDHALHVTDIGDIEEAADRLGQWAGKHVDNCTGADARDFAREFGDDLARVACMDG